SVRPDPRPAARGGGGENPERNSLPGGTARSRCIHGGPDITRNCDAHRHVVTGSPRHARKSNARVTHRIVRTGLAFLNPGARSLASHWKRPTTYDARFQIRFPAVDQSAGVH